eukprot:TRINITY_DN12701_c0_g1_i1.p1 TRINITY_DN12701_c0_g1~~TRINITY_DN12701_c0_g1_i1.p1  ORF type:complete len:478 (+),score=111.41 TRINITY_DN12701_c0_g1_i1:82-1434(+)
MLAAACAVALAAGAVIPTPTPAQLRYQSTDFVALIHFNMGTYAHNGDPCCDPSNWDVKASYAAGKTSDPATFNPVKLNTTQWMESITGLGANIAVLTAKHGCGFALWPTKTTLPDGSPYGYSVASPGAFGRDVLREFVDAAGAAGVGYGFYYSIMKSFYLCRSFSGTNSCMKTVLPGQHNLTDSDYLKVATQMVTELWTQYGNLTEIWVDSGLDGLGPLMQKLQPQAGGTPYSPRGWCGTESGYPSRDCGSGDVWSLGSGNHGDPNSTQYNPKFCDPQLFQEHIWFWEPNLKVRSLETMIPIYHDIVGRGMVMELAFSIDRDGLVEDTHATVYKQLGAWVRSCYGAPLALAAGGESTVITVPAGSTFDRFQMKENVATGQRIRAWVIEQAGAAGQWQQLASGQAIGQKRIVLLKAPVTVQTPTMLRLRITASVAPPDVSSFGAYRPCPTK